MKKFAVLALAALLVVAFVLPAAAMEFEFGGYWRTRAYTNQNFTGEDVTEAQDWTVVDTRTRLYLTAVFHENLKFVNMFEMDAVWGSNADGRDAKSIRADGKPSNKSYGQPGADGANLEIKNSYADFNLGALNAKVGVQGIYLGRGFLLNADMAAAVLNFRTDTLSIPFIWAKAYEGGTGLNARDVDFFALAPAFTFGDVTVNPYALYVYSDNAEDFSMMNDYDEIAAMGATNGGFSDLNMFFVGLDADMTFDPVSVWLTGIYQGGDVEFHGTNNSMDFNAWLAALGFKVNMGFGDVHGQAFWATGPDRGDDPDPTESERFWMPGNLVTDSYYWAEIMGYGIFDWQLSNNAPGDSISDVQAANLGVTIKPMDKLTVAFDVWYARLDDDWFDVEDLGNDQYLVDVGDDAELGTELDLRVTYQLVPGMNIDLVGAYLFAGDATTQGAKDDADPYEIGTRLSLSF